MGGEERLQSRSQQKGVHPQYSVLVAKKKDNLKIGEKHFFLFVYTYTLHKRHVFSSG
jgi:hypothetical protein